MVSLELTMKIQLQSEGWPVASFVTKLCFENLMRYFWNPDHFIICKMRACETWEYREFQPVVFKFGRQSKKKKQSLR